MRKTNDTSDLATLDDHRPLADSELDAVTGGTIGSITQRRMGSLSLGQPCERSSSDGT